MKVWQFTEQPYYPVWDETPGPLKNTLPNKHVDPTVAADLYSRYLDEWELCDELGINILINEHHSTATCLSSRDKQINPAAKSERLAGAPQSGA